MNYTVITIIPLHNMACKLVHHKFITCSVLTALQILVLQPTKVEPEVSLWESFLAFFFNDYGDNNMETFSALRFAAR